MANVLFTRKNASEIPNVPITDGQLIFDTSGNGKMYLDNGTRRLEMGGSLTVDATLSKTSTNPVQNKAVAGVMLDTLSDISNVTSKGFLADALAVKELNNNLTATDSTKFRFATDGEGNYGYLKADDSFVPFKSKLKKTLLAHYEDMFGIAQGEKPWTYNASGIDGYKDLTVDNFVLDDFTFRAASHGTNDAKNNTSQTKTYDANSGLLTFSTMRTGKGWSMGGICKCNLYLLR